MSRVPKSDNVFRVGEPVRMIINIAEEKQRFHATVTSPSKAQIECHIEGIVITRFFYMQLDFSNGPGDAKTNF